MCARIYFIFLNSVDTFIYQWHGKDKQKSEKITPFGRIFFHFGQVSCVFPFATRKWVDARSLSQIPSSVATSRRRNDCIIWKQPKITLPLHSLRQAAPQQSKASFDCIRFALSLHSKTSCSGIRVSFFFIFAYVWLLIEIFSFLSIWLNSLSYC